MRPDICNFDPDFGLKRGQPKPEIPVPNDSGSISVCFHVTHLRAVNRRSGLDFGWTATGKASKSVLRLAEGRPEGRFRFFPESNPAKIRPGRPIAGPEALLCNIDYPWEGFGGVCGGLGLFLLDFCGFWKVLLWPYKALLATLRRL